MAGTPAHRPTPSADASFRAHPDRPTADAPSRTRSDRPAGPGRRRFLQAGALAAGFTPATQAVAATAPSAAPAAGPSAPAPSAPTGGQQLQWLVVDTHVHSLFSHDAKYQIETILDQAEHFGVDAIAFTEHSNWGYANEGGVFEVSKRLQTARDERDLLVFQGLEWYIPAAEHGTVLIAPGAETARVLRSFQLQWDGKLNKWEHPEPGSPEEQQWEQFACDGIQWLAEQKADGVIDDVLVLANHPMRYGIDSPHEMRKWQDADPGIFIGMEGAPGAQGSAFGTNRDPKYQRGEYENARKPQTYAGYPDEALRTRGGFDWSTSVVGGLWDALLSEGRRYWIISNSDFHLKTYDTRVIGAYPDNPENPWEEGASLGNFNRAGRRPNEEESGQQQGGSDYWPGEFSRTHVGATDRSHTAVMQALREGRIWVDHGHLVAALDVRLAPADGSIAPVTLGGELRVPRGTELELVVTVTPTTTENSFGILPELAHLDLITGEITGAADDPDTITAPATRVRERVETAGRGRDPFEVRFTLGAAEKDGYLRLRGSDGKRSGVGPMGAEVDPAGPIPHGGGPDEGNPWADTWLYTNPIFVTVH